MTQDRDLLHLHPTFRAKVQLVANEMTRWCQAHMPGYHCIMLEGFRSTARQAELYAQGRTKPGQIVTNCNGVETPSNHQSSLAADLVAVDGKGNIDWRDNSPFWAYLGHTARANGLKWGGDWKRPDCPHIEWDTADKAAYSKAHVWQMEEGLR